MANVGIPSVPSSLECFTSEVATTAIQYIQTTLFQHYALFEYLFTEEQETETHATRVRSSVGYLKWDLETHTREVVLGTHAVTCFLQIAGWTRSDH